MTLPGRTASDGKDALHVRIQQAFAQNALPNHATGAEQNNLHGILYLGSSWAITRLNASSPPAAAHDGARAPHNTTASVRLASAASL